MFAAAKFYSLFVLLCAGFCQSDARTCTRSALPLQHAGGGDSSMACSLASHAGRRGDVCCGGESKDLGQPASSAVPPIEEEQVVPC